WIQDCKGELYLSAPDRKIPVQLSLTTLELDEGTSLSIIITDLSNQKKNQELLRLKNQELERSNKALETSNHELQQFASIASHDLQEPLRKIQIFSSRMQEDAELLPAPLPVYLKKIVDSATRMKSLIIDILNYSKLSADTTHIECTELNEVLEELLTDFDLLIEERQAQITVDPIPCLMVNKGQIRQVFQNLISNALKFTRKDQSPVIHIHAVRVAEPHFESREDASGPYCVISIQDNGIGFDEKYVSSVFSLFKRLNTAEQYEGSGIGMAIAKKIIEKHDGLITATSVVGSGSCFKILLPVA
ncbi:MAG TPA: ATP-binding protein, partial [Flavisolibacter sp.]|nr:ATP-binding protein [Flavisolibacter sp.]